MRLCHCLLPRSSSETEDKSPRGVVPVGEEVNPKLPSYLQVGRMIFGGAFGCGIRNVVTIHVERDSLPPKWCSVDTIEDSIVAPARTLPRKIVRVQQRQTLTQRRIRREPEPLGPQSTPAGGEHYQSVTCFDIDGCLPRQPLTITAPDQPVFTNGSRSTSRQTPRNVPSSLTHE